MNENENDEKTKSFFRENGDSHKNTDENQMNEKTNSFFQENNDVYRYTDKNENGEKTNSFLRESGDSSNKLKESDEEEKINSFSQEKRDDGHKKYENDKKLFDNSKPFQGFRDPSIASNDNEDIQRFLSDSTDKSTEDENFSPNQRSELNQDNEHDSNDDSRGYSENDDDELSGAERRAKAEQSKQEENQEDRGVNLKEGVNLENTHQSPEYGKQHKMLTDMLHSEKLMDGSSIRKFL